VGSGRHFKDRWKELLASQTAATDGSKETGEQSELDESGLNSALVFVRRYRRGVLVVCLCVLSICAAVVHVYPYGSSTARRSLHGRVQVDRVGIARGSISFLPTAENSGPAANTAIVNGEYRFSKETGPYCGSHRVLIDVDAPSGEEDVLTDHESAQVDKRIDGEAFLARNKQLGSSRKQAKRTIKRHWEIEYTVPDDGEDRKDFDLSG